MKLTAALIAPMLVLTTLPAPAETPVVTGGATLEYLDRPDGRDAPNVGSLAAYAQVDVSGFYAGVWARAANVDSYTRIDWYLGYARSFDSGFDWSVGYYRYGYPSDRASDYGELQAGIGQTLGEAAYVSLDLAYDPENELGNAYLGVEWYPADAWTVSANWGTYEVDAATRESEWDLGATYGLTDASAVDLRWYDGSDYVRGYIGLSLSFDTTLFGG